MAALLMVYLPYLPTVAETLMVKKIIGRLLAAAMWLMVAWVIWLISG